MAEANDPDFVFARDPWMENAGEWLLNLQELITSTLDDGFIILKIHLREDLELAPGLSEKPTSMFGYPVAYDDSSVPVQVSVEITVDHDKKARRK